MLRSEARCENDARREVQLRVLPGHLACSPQPHVSLCLATGLPHRSGPDAEHWSGTLRKSSFVGFAAVNSIVAGQVLVAINPGHLSTTTGIVIVAVVSMVISFFGYRVLHACERWACEFFFFLSFFPLRSRSSAQFSRSILAGIPVCLAFVLLAGFGGRHLGAAASFNVGQSTKGGILSFISIVVGFTRKRIFSSSSHPSTTRSRSKEEKRSH